MLRSYWTTIIYQSFPSLFLSQSPAQFSVAALLPTPPPLSFYPRNFLTEGYRLIFPQGEVAKHIIFMCSNSLYSSWQLRCGHGSHLHAGNGPHMDGAEGFDDLRLGGRRGQAPLPQQAGLVSCNTEEEHVKKSDCPIALCYPSPPSFKGSVRYFYVSKDLKMRYTNLDTLFG